MFRLPYVLFYNLEKPSIICDGDRSAAFARKSSTRRASLALAERRRNRHESNRPDRCFFTKCACQKCGSPRTSKLGVPQQRLAAGAVVLAKLSELDAARVSAHGRPSIVHRLTFGGPIRDEPNECDGPSPPAIWIGEVGNHDAVGECFYRK